MTVAHSLPLLIESVFTNYLTKKTLLSTLHVDPSVTSKTDVNDLSML